MNSDFARLSVPKVKAIRGVEIKLTKLFNALIPGMHIAVNKYLADCWHHGIYVGQESGTHMIVDMRRNKSSALVERRSIDDFLTGAVRICAIQYETDSLCEQASANAALVRALSTTTPEAARSLFSIFAGNCESFAFWCRTGYCDIVPDNLLFRDVSSYVPGFK